MFRQVPGIFISRLGLAVCIRPVRDARVVSRTLQVPGIFISRLVPGGLAESTGLLAVNDEVIEVNGIEVASKSLDQVSSAGVVIRQPNGLASDRGQ